MTNGVLKKRPIAAKKPIGLEFRHPTLARRLLLATALLAAVLTSGCEQRRRDAAFAVAFADAQSIEAPSARFNTLLALDQAEPARAELKSELGWLAFQLTANAEQALIFLNQAREQVNAQRAERRMAPEARAELHRRLARVELAAADYTAAIADAQLAVALAPAAQRGEAALLAARALTAGGANQDALAAYDQERASWSTWERLDLQLYAQLLATEERVADARDTYLQLIERAGFEPGAGFALSVAYEQLGDLSASLVVAALSAEVSRFASGEPGATAALLERLRGLGEQWGGEASAPAHAMATLGALESFFAEAYPAAAAAFAALEPAPPFSAYFRTVAALETGTGSGPSAAGGAFSAVLAQYQLLEPLLSNTAVFHHRLWRARSLLPDYGLAAARAPAESVVELAPGTPAAVAARAELARLVGLSPEQAPLLLLAHELDASFTDYLLSNDEQYLAGALGMLSLPDNTFSLTAVVGLTILRQRDARLAAVLATRRDAASGRTHERLNAILGDQ